MDDGSDEEGSQQSGGGSSHRSFKSQLDKALTARQEAEARVATLEEKIQQFETGKVKMKLKVIRKFMYICEAVNVSRWSSQKYPVGNPTCLLQKSFGLSCYG